MNRPVTTTLPRAVRQADRLGPRTRGDGHPVDPAEERGDQSADDARGDQVVGHGRPFPIAGRQSDAVEDDRRGQQAQREDDEHLVDGMP
jgi:hypothetical protein